MTLDTTHPTLPRQLFVRQEAELANQRAAAAAPNRIESNPNPNQPQSVSSVQSQLKRLDTYRDRLAEMFTYIRAHKITTLVRVAFLQESSSRHIPCTIRVKLQVSFESRLLNQTSKSTFKYYGVLRVQIYRILLRGPRQAGLC